MPEQTTKGDDDGSPHNSDRSDTVDAALDAAVTRAASGDEDAVRYLYRTIQPRLLNYLRALVGETDAEDVASEAWSRIAHDLRSFRGAAGDFRAWTATIARHRAIDHLRRRRPSIPLPPQEIPHWPARDDTEREAIDAISTATALVLISQLPTDQAQAILLRVVIGLDATTAGRILGKRPGAIHMAAQRGLRSLARRTQPPGTPRERSGRAAPRIPGVTPSARQGLKEAT